MDFAGGPDQRLPLPGGDLFGQQDFDTAGRLPRLLRHHAVRVEASREDACVIQHQQVARAQQAGEVAEVAVLADAGGTIEREHARARALSWRRLRDQVLWQVEVVIGNQLADSDVPFARAQAGTCCGTADGLRGK